MEKSIQASLIRPFKVLYDEEIQFEGMIIRICFYEEETKRALMIKLGNLALGIIAYPRKEK